MNASSLRTANAIALARRKLLSRPSICDFEKSRLLQQCWAGGLGGAQFSSQVATARGAWEYQFRHGGLTQRLMSMTSTLRARKNVKKPSNAPPPPISYNIPHRTPPPRPQSSSQPKPSIATSKPTSDPSADPSSPIPPEPPSKPSKLSYQIFCVLGFGFAVYIAILYVSIKRDMEKGATLSVPEDVSNRYDDIAKTFDSTIDASEVMLRISRMRWKLCRKAKGDVCEVSIGTGRNLKYYPWEFVKMEDKKFRDQKNTVTSFTAVDKSPEMLEIAHEKFGELYPGFLGPRWVVQDASEPLPPPPASANELSGHKVGKKFDTIVQTFGLCSAADPVKLLKNLGDSLEPDGRILLLEHGRGKYKFINKLLDGLAPTHADRYGCWFNRDIGKIIEDSGLEVVRIQQRHLGTTWWAELKLKPSRTVKREEKMKETTESKNGKSWLTGWWEGPVRRVE